MGRTVSAFLLSLIALSGLVLQAGAQESNGKPIAVARPGAANRVQSPAPTTSAASPFARPAAAAAPAATPAGSQPVINGQPALANPLGTPAQPGLAAPAVGPDGLPVPVIGPSQFLSQAQLQFKNNPNPATFAEFMRVFKGFLASPGVSKMPAAAIIKANPVLSELGVRVTEAGSGRIWSFPRIPHGHEVVVQWHDTKAVVTFVGRRHRKHVSYSTVSRMQALTLPPSVTLKDARVIGGEEGARYLVLVGDDSGSSLWLHAYKSVDGQWTSSPDHFSTIPSFLTENMSGRVTFRGSDLIFNVGRVVPPSGDQTTRLPEAESSTYRFWVKLTDTGYVLQRHVPDIAQFSAVRQLLDALAGNRTDVAKTLVTDSKLLSIPKYVGVRTPSSTFRVVQMASPPSGAPRYRIITGQRNDLIFEVARVKDRATMAFSPVVRAIFIAPPDPFLQEISKILPTYDQVVPAAPAPTDTTAAAAGGNGATVTKH